MRFVRPVRHFIKALCELAQYGRDELETISLVITELLNNSIEHGCNKPEDEIDVRLIVTDSRFRFAVTDPGRGGKDFADQALDRAKLTPNLEDPRGRGLFLIRTYMDEFAVQYDPNVGTTFVVAKSLQARES